MLESVVRFTSVMVLFARVGVGVSRVENIVYPSCITLSAGLAPLKMGSVISEEKQEAARRSEGNRTEQLGQTVAKFQQI